MLLKRIFVTRCRYALYKRFIALRSRVILNKRVRHRWKWIQTQKMLDRLVTKTVWGVSYSVFDGEELLEDSIKSIRDNVDYINVVYQRHSWYGNPAKPGLVKLLQRLHKSGLIDELIEYVPNYKMSAGKQERFKRNIGLKHAKKHGVDYFMCMDTDEFYLSCQMHSAKREIIKNGITHSFCPIVVYVTPTQRLLNTPGCFVQWFSYVGMLSNLKYNKHNVALVDPTRQLNHIPFSKYYVLSGIEMHHMSGYRKDILLKLKNSSLHKFNKMSANTFKKRLTSNTVKVQDVFNITKF